MSSYASPVLSQWFLQGFRSNLKATMRFSATIIARVKLNLINGAHNFVPYKLRHKPSFFNS